MKSNTRILSLRQSFHATHLGITPTTGLLFRKDLKSLLSLLSEHFERHPVLLSCTASLAEFAFIGPSYAHLSRDPIPLFMIKTSAPLVWEWMERVAGFGRFAGKHVERWDAHKGTFVSDHGAQSEFEEADQVQFTMTIVAKLLMLEFLPIPTNAVAKTIKHLSAPPQNGNPLFLTRFLEHHTFHISASSAPGAERATGSAVLQTYPVWMLQRILERMYKTPEQKEASDSWIKEFGGDSILKGWQDCVGKWIANGWYVGGEKNKLVGTRS